MVGSVAVLSILSALSYNLLSDFELLGKNINDLMDYFSNQILLPLGGLFIAIFVGWFVKKQSTADELGFYSGPLFQLWHFLIRYAVPPAVAIIFYFGVVE